MREFSFRWQEGLFKGLRPNAVMPKNSPYLYDAYNVRVGSFGLERPTPISTLITGTDVGKKFTDISWPMPQIIRTSIGVFAADDAELRSFDPTIASPFTVVLTGLSNTLSYQYDVADFGLYQFWTNGSTCILRSDAGVWSVYAATLKPYTVCNYRGQLVAGGFGSTTYKNIVAWSGIGEVDPAILFSTSLGVDTTDYSTQKNTSGNRRMDWSGQVLTVKPLGKYVIIYGENGITAMAGVEEPAPTFGFINLKDFGILNRGVVGGDEKGHVFVDKDDWLWSVDTELNFKRLGYKEYIAPLHTGIGPKIIVSLDPYLRDYYIAGASTVSLGSLLLADGLSKIPWTPTSIIRENTYTSVGGSLFGPRLIYGDYIPYVVTEIFDMQNRTIKFLPSLAIGHESTNVYAAVDYKYKSSEVFRTTSYKTISKEGLVSPQISGIEFRLRIKGAIV